MEVPAARTVIVEGVGAGTAPGIHTLVWVEAPADQRRLRALARDGDTFVGHWDAWAAAESVHFARHPTRDRADVVIRG